MAPKKQQLPPSADPNGMFRGIVAFLVPNGVQPRRPQVWKQKLIQMGGVIDEKLSKRTTHILAIDSNQLHQQVNSKQLHHFRGSVLSFKWLESCLQAGEKLPEQPFVLMVKENSNEVSDSMSRKSPEATDSADESKHFKRIKQSSDNTENHKMNSPKEDHQELIAGGHQATCTHVDEDMSIDKGPGHHVSSPSSCEDVNPSNKFPRALEAEAGADVQSSPYSPPDLNRNITEIFEKLINIYRALGDDRRSFSYYKAIPMIEKLPFKIENVDQVKGLPAIGKSLQDHIHEIVTTGKLSKLEHFENDEKVRTVSLFGEVWGIGPATALKLYEKGHRTLEDLGKDESLTNAQKIGLRFFDDIKQRILRHEVRDMEMLIQKVGEDILPRVIVVCGGSYRRGKATCGDMDIVITHPDGESHKGLLPRLVQQLKDINFLREDLIFSMHSTEGTDSGVDTYFGLCTYPGQELRHRIDLKVYPRDRFAFGLIAWTGNDVLNRRLRLLAESKGYRLDDTGLYLATQSSIGKRGIRSNAIVKCDTEKDVFGVLGFPWLEPHERNL